MSRSDGEKAKNVPAFGVRIRVDARYANDDVIATLYFHLISFVLFDLYYFCSLKYIQW